MPFGLGDGLAPTVIYVTVTESPFRILGLLLSERLLPLSAFVVFIAMVLLPRTPLASNHNWKIGVILASYYLELVFSCWDLTNKTGPFGATCFQRFKAKISCWKINLEL